MREAINPLMKVDKDDWSYGHDLLEALLFCSTTKESYFIPTREEFILDEVVSATVDYIHWWFGEKKNEIHFRNTGPGSRDNFERIGEISIEDDLNLSDRGVYLRIKISENHDSIQIGKYDIAADHFAILSYYVAKGGLLGFLDEDKPDFARLALKEIRNSKNPLYGFYNNKY
jgi:hypothetical protein